MRATAKRWQSQKLFSRKMCKTKCKEMSRTTKHREKEEKCDLLKRPFKTLRRQFAQLKMDGVLKSCFSTRV